MSNSKEDYKMVIKWDSMKEVYVEEENKMIGVM